MSWDLVVWVLVCFYGYLFVVGPMMVVMWNVLKKGWTSR